MGRFPLVCRLAARDLHRRPAEAALLLLALVAATTTLTLGLVLHGVTSQPYQSTRSATAGPDVVAQADPSESNRGSGADLLDLEALAHARGVVARSGPYPLVEAVAKARGRTAAVQVEGRDAAPASVDQPKLTHGSWVGAGGVVVEAAFADALGVGTGDSLTVNGHRFRIRGVAVTAAIPPYPALIFFRGPESPAIRPGLIWLTRTDARRLIRSPRALSYVLNLKLADPTQADTFAYEHSLGSPPGSTRQPPILQSWQEIQAADGNLVRNERRVLLTGSSLLALLALASIAVLVGGRMADQVRRVGLLKAVGGTPRLIASVLLAEYLAIALLGAAVGLAAGRLAAPTLSDPGAGLIGASDASLTASTIGLVIAVAFTVAAVGAFVPAVRASRISTVVALADSARSPRRSAWLTALSARLPVPLLLGLRVAARRPRRAVLCTVSVAITVSGIVAALAAHAQLHAKEGVGSSGLANPRTDRLNEILLLITVMLVAQAAVNAIFVTWATVLDAKHSSALVRALGATQKQVSTGLGAAQVLPAFAGALLGVPGGIGLFAAVNASGATIPPLPWLLATVLGSVLVIAGLAAIPARISAGRSVAAVLQSGSA